MGADDRLRRVRLFVLSAADVAAGLSRAHVRHDRALERALHLDPVARRGDRRPARRRLPGRRADPPRYGCDARAQDDSGHRDALRPDHLRRHDDARSQRRDRLYHDRAGGSRGLGADRLVDPGPHRPARDGRVGRLDHELRQQRDVDRRPDRGRLRRRFHRQLHQRVPHRGRCAGCRHPELRLSARPDRADPRTALSRDGRLDRRRRPRHERGQGARRDAGRTRGGGRLGILRARDAPTALRRARCRSGVPRHDARADRRRGRRTARRRRRRGDRAFGRHARAAVRRSRRRCRSRAS